MGMSTTIIDVETSIFQKGNPFARRNRLCYVGAYPERGTVATYNATQLSDIQRQVNSSTLLVGFAFKFDLHWLRRLGIVLTHQRVWDCQVARFLLEAQTTSLSDNSLDGAAAHYGGAGKSGSLTSYWDAGIDTPDIPLEIVTEYLEGDLLATMRVYHQQVAAFKLRPLLYNLFLLNMDDLLVLEEMEWNGLKFNVEKAQIEEKKIVHELEAIEEQLRKRCPNTPINLDSCDHLSAYLYGGTITIPRKEPNGIYKTGPKVGQIKYKWVEDVHTLTRLLDPVKNSALKKEGLWSAAEDILKQVRQTKEVVLLQERSKLIKLKEYLVSFPMRITDNDWDKLHGQFNQCIARTGRLTSSSPNLQNLPDPMLQLIETRYV